MNEETPQEKIARLKLEVDEYLRQQNMFKGRVVKMSWKSDDSPETQNALNQIFGRLAKHNRDRALGIVPENWWPEDSTAYLRVTFDEAKPLPEPKTWTLEEIEAELNG